MTTHIQRLITAQRADAKAQAEAQARRQRLKDTTLSALKAKQISEYEAADLANMSRETIRRWQGKDGATP